MKINRQTHRALSKHSDHPRIVFIDVNDGRREYGRGTTKPLPLVEAENQLKLYEQDQIGKALPQAYVIVTYEPDEHHLDRTDLTSGMLLWGFHQEDLRPGLKTLLQQVETRRSHAPIYSLLESMRRHRHIPATFDGEADAFLSPTTESRLTVGQKMKVLGPDGKQVDAIIESGVVVPEQKEAWCVVCSDEQQRSMVKIPLTAEELHAYAQHPATFFGVIDRSAGRSPPTTDLDWFDFLWETYSQSPKEKLLEFMGHAPDFEQLRAMTQEELATKYCVRMACSLPNPKIVGER